MGPRFFLLLLLSGCSLAVTRPVQDMSDTASAIRAAKEVQADVLAPEYYRQSKEWFFKARREYKFKNFKEAKEYALRSRRLAERAEYLAVLHGASRSSLGADAAPPPPPPSDDLNTGADEIEAPEGNFEEDKGQYFETVEEERNRVAPPPPAPK